MAEAAAPETPLLPRAKRGPAQAAAGQAYRWRPLLVALACAVLALALLAHGWNLLRLHTTLDADAELIEAASAQRAHAEQIGRLAALVAADAAGRRQHAMALRALLDTAAEDATALDERLASQRPLDAGQAAAAAQAWRAASERLWRWQAIYPTADRCGVIIDYKQRFSAIGVPNAGGVIRSTHIRVAAGGQDALAIRRPVCANN